ncbi:hypothetical protein CY35_04G064000 [Sphagnum magellanicum]|nr:hypothetical protein CY35_04G064000 [Sphagnum magellanicum]KAH9565172.1 hypothetical protein CY35_04G064000 [Sphagnum magellanicum]
MRLDGDATTVAASPASESLWGVVGLIQQARDRSPLSVARIAEREREEVVVRRREESRRREEEKRERALQERKREGKVHNRDEKRTQSSPVPLMTVVVVPPSPPSSSPRFIVGYALTSKKIKSFIQPKLESHASTKGISLVAINRNKLLTEQGPFDVILHKITGKEWRQELEDYKQKYPDVIVLDPPEAIQQLRNRQSMLQDVAQLNLCDCGGHVGVPRQLVITGDAASIPSSVAKAGLKLPLVVKPLVADGTAKSHAMSLAYDKYCLTELDPPLVLQEFVNHGGVLFKVYIVGDQIRVVRRFSLPDVQEGKDACSGAIPFPRVSNAAATAEEADLDPQAAELPPPRLLDCLSRELRHRLGLRLFNLDMIREGGAGDHYYVIDINYFPGYGKMPDYEFVFTDFLLSLARSKGRLGL